MVGFAPLSFQPERHAAVLEPLLAELLPVLRERAAVAENAPLSIERLRPYLRRYPKDARGFFSRAELIAGLRAFEATLGVRHELERLTAQLRMRPVRTQSGVTPITVLTKPFPCPGQCVFCPSDVRMPKSYLSREPGAQRAELSGFDPYLQTYHRLRALSAIGHAVDKAELIILGGTFSFYPASYQRWFVHGCLEALSDFGAGIDRRQDAGQARIDHDGPAALAPLAEEQGRYNRAVTPLLRRAHGPSLLHAREDCSLEALLAAQRRNESARCRNVGLVIETRPDHVTEREVLQLRQLGCTKVQLGVQSVDDEVLRKNRRGHDVEAVRRALRLLRLFGFKVLVHYMPNLLGATPELDVRGAQQLFSDPALRPDELKVYPCSLVETADLMQSFERGEYEPYSHAQLVAVLADILASTPRYCRLSRVIRDISSCDIVAGNRVANLREEVEDVLRAQGRACHDIRSREVRQEKVQAGELSLRATSYETASSGEEFLELVTQGDRLAGFVRLSLPTEPALAPELSGCAIIRELHVYGAALALGAREQHRPQHRGLGERLVHAAVSRARQAGYAELAVISAVGTRGYYRRLGFVDGELYQRIATREPV